MTSREANRDGALADDEMHRVIGRYKFETWVNLTLKRKLNHNFEKKLNQKKEKKTETRLNSFLHLRLD